MNLIFYIYYSIHTSINVKIQIRETYGTYIGVETFWFKAGQKSNETGSISGLVWYFPGNYGQFLGLFYNRISRFFVVFLWHFLVSSYGPLMFQFWPRIFFAWSTLISGLVLFSARMVWVIFDNLFWFHLKFVSNVHYNVKIRFKIISF